MPRQCPNRDCRQRLVLGVADEISREKVLSGLPEAELGKTPTDGARGSFGDTQPVSGGMGDGVHSDSGVERPGKGKGLSAEQFMNLSNSDKLRAKRAGKAP